MKMKTLALCVGAALLACGFSAQASEVQLYGAVATGLYYQKAEGADQATVGMAQYKQTPTDSHFGLKGREDLGNGWYVGFQVESGWSLDSGSLFAENTLFNRVARLYMGNETVEVSAGRMSTFTCASEPYSVFRKLRANMTGSGLPGMAPALMVYNAGELENVVAFATTAKEGFFLQGLYSNGSNKTESTYDWSDRNHVGQMAFGWTGGQLRVGSVLSWELPDQTAKDVVRKKATKGIHLVGSYDFGPAAVSAIFYKGWNDWRIGGAPDMAQILKTGSGVNNMNASSEGMDTTVGFVSVGMPKGAHYFSAGLGLVDARWKGVSTGMTETKGMATLASVMYYYNLSKRTQLYTGASYSNGTDLLDGVDRFNQVFGTFGIVQRF
ncbi:MAG: porin [Sutterella wadsworthensis]|nr:porin [Sutterella wadsworthensis]